MKMTLVLILVVLFGIACYHFGKKSVDPIVLQCEDNTKNVLVASRFNKDEIICAYVEPWQIKGKIKRKERVI